MVISDPAAGLLVAEIDHPKPAASQPPPDDLKELQELYELMLQEGLESVELEGKSGHIRLQRAERPPTHHIPRKEALESTAETASQLKSIVTPLAGVFYRASSPTSAPFVTQDTVVNPGQTLCIVEAMKVMNEIKAETRCRIVKIVAENSRPVTAGQTLFLVGQAE